jgi:hypothetical protein
VSINHLFLKQVNRKEREESHAKIRKALLAKLQVTLGFAFLCGLLAIFAVFFWGQSSSSTVAFTH